MRPQVLGKQMRIAANLFRQCPLCGPDHGWRDVDAGPKIIGFDCMKCPVAAFLQ